MSVGKKDKNQTDTTSLQFLDQPVKELMRHVGRQIILPTFGHLDTDDIFAKGQNDHVTRIDHESEIYLTVVLSKLLPDCAVIGEEAVAETPALLEKLQQDQPTWIIDPLDGTNNYIKGDPNFAVIIALVQQDQILAGWIYDVIQDQFAWAFAGQGCWYQDQRIVINRKQGQKKLTGSIPYHLNKQWQLVEDRDDLPVNVMQSLSCAGQDYLRLLRHEMDFVTFKRSNPWDHAAGALIWREAGGEVCNWAVTDIYRPSQKRGGVLASASQAELRFLSEALQLT